MEKEKPIPRKSSKSRIICISSIVAGVLLIVIGIAVAITLILVLVVFKPKEQLVTTNTITSPTTTPTSTSASASQTTASLSDAFSEAMTNGTIFPNGSYSLKFSSITLVSNSYNPLEVNSTVLQSAYITEDSSNSLLVSGRQNFYYVRIPATTSSRKKRAAEETQTLGEQMGNEQFEMERLAANWKAAASTGVSGIGIRFGSSSEFAVIPTSLAADSSSGVRSTTLSDSSTLFEIKASAPSRICSVSSSSCESIQWTAYAILSGGKSAAAGPSKSVYASCGDQCSSGSSSMCSQTCQSCSAQTVAGADTPVSRQYYMGKSSGSFMFQYETYSVKDRIKVIYENAIIFDTGCVGASGTKTISFSGQSTEIRVDVEPNCLGTTGTAWYFITGCPSLCSSTSGKMLVSADQKALASGDKIYITSAPAMPALKAEYCDSTVSSSSITWSIRIDPLSAIGGNIATVCPTLSFSSTGSTIDITNIVSSIIGGSYTVSATANGATQSLTFTVLGTNPAASDIKTYILSSISSYVTSSITYWFVIPVAEQESSFVQFTSNRYPLKSSDNGYGIYQLTNPVPTCYQVWNWKSNVAEGLRRLRSFRVSDALTWMNNQRAQALAQKGYAVPVPTVTDEKCTFAVGTSQTCEDAVALKMYNGASGGNYCAWDYANGVWKFNKNNTQTPPRDYVGDVCKHL